MNVVQKRRPAWHPSMGPRVAGFNPRKGSRKAPSNVSSEHLAMPENPTTSLIKCGGLLMWNWKRILQGYDLRTQANLSNHSKSHNHPQANQLEQLQRPPPTISTTTMKPTTALLPLLAATAAAELATTTTTTTLSNPTNHPAEIDARNTPRQVSSPNPTTEERGITLEARHKGHGHGGKNSTSNPTTEEEKRGTNLEARHKDHGHGGKNTTSNPTAEEKRGTTLEARHKGHGHGGKNSTSNPTVEERGILEARRRRNRNKTSSNYTATSAADRAGGVGMGLNWGVLVGTFGVGVAVAGLVL